MERGFAQCRARDSKFGGFTEFLLAHRRVETQVVAWWREARCAKGITLETSSWEVFKQFLRTRFLDKSVVSDKAVVPEVQAKVDEDDTPLRGMSIQLHKLSNGDEGRNQRYSLFQTQCTIKEKACKLIIDSGSYCNGIGRAVVASLGLSTWRIPEPKHVEWLNSCGVLKVTHEVRVTFSLTLCQQFIYLFMLFRVSGHVMGHLGFCVCWVWACPSPTVFWPSI
jgi:hypothetical protein